MVSHANAVLESRQYDPIGNAIGTTSTSQTSYGFTGEMTFGDLLHLRARDYNPALGVFTALDPFEGMMQRPMSLNGYSYVEGNVPNRADPSGKITINVGCSMFFSIPGTGGDLQKLIEAVKELQEIICGTEYTVGICTDLMEGNYTGFVGIEPEEGSEEEINTDDEESVKSCFESLSEMCQALCGGNFLETELFQTHGFKGLLRRWLEFADNRLNLDKAGQDDHFQPYDDIQRLLRGVMDNWGSRKCKTTSGELDLLVQTAKEWQQRPLPIVSPFSFGNPVCIPGTNICFTPPILLPIA